MKKILMFLVSVTLLVSLALVGCESGCNASNIDFTNNFSGGTTIQSVGYQEKLTYSVKYDGEGATYQNLKKSASTDSYIDKDGIKYEGSLVTTFTSAYKTDIPQNVQSNIFDSVNVTLIYIFKTELNLTSSYTFKGETTPIVVNDKITSEVYFLPEGQSFAPIYSYYSADSYSFKLSETSRLARTKLEYITTYDLSEFTVEKNIVKYSAIMKNPSEEVAQPAQTDTVKGSYGFRKAIDNNQLLFAVRSYQTNTDTTDLMSVLTPAYNKPVNIALSAHTEDKHVVTFEPTATGETISVRNFTMQVGEQNASGKRHHFSVQTDKSNNVKNNALLVRYAQPLFDYGTVSCIGALEFNLTQVVYA